VISTTSSRRSGSIKDVAGAGAGGACALALVAGADIAFLLRAGLPLASPERDLSLLAMAGAVAGAVVGLARMIPALSFFSPFGILLGLGVALQLWLPEAAGSRIVGEGAFREAIRGGLFLMTGAVAGQLAGLALRRLVRVRPGPVVAIAFVALLLSPRFLPGRGGSATAGPNVLLLTIDTLRADRLGFAGHPRPVSPHLDRLARRGVCEIRAITPLPRTLPAIASVMTGMLPHTHGVRDNFHYSLGPDALTLAERLRDAGWVTAAVNSNPVLSHSSGVYQGFASASDRGDDWSRLTIVRGTRRILSLLAMRSGDRALVITDLALAWLRDRPRSGPFFLWVHWLSPHMPYEPAFPFDRRFDPDYEGDYDDSFHYGRVSKGEMTYRNPLDSRTREHAIALYDGEVATSDRALGRLLREMELTGDLDQTIVVFTSDHGESLDEHGYFFNHGDFVYGPAATVPLIFVSPDGADGSSVRRRGTSLVDLFPELWSATTEAPLPTSDGVPFDEPRSAQFGESGFCRFPHLNERLGWLLPREIAQSPDRVPDWQAQWEGQANRAKQRFVEIDDWKLVVSPGPTGDRFELFDLAADPGETVDVSDQWPERTRELAALVQAWIDEGESQEPTAGERVIDEATREQLNALGYTGD
jgi:arylsulfatase A-like enzyme